jgi:hypothetical protein
MTGESLTDAPGDNTHFLPLGSGNSVVQYSNMRTETAQANIDPSQLVTREMVQIARFALDIAADLANSHPDDPNIMAVWEEAHDRYSRICAFAQRH